MQLDLTTTALAEVYHRSISTVASQPIAQVSTLSAGGVSSLAPFNFSQVIGNEPLTLTVNVNLRNSGSFKNILRNARATRQLVIHLVGIAQAETMNVTSAWLPHGMNEIEMISIPTVFSIRAAPPRTATAAVAFEYEVAEIKPYPVESPNCHLILARVLLTHVDDAVLADECHVDGDRLDLVDRLGDSHYSYTRSTFSMIRPGQPGSVRRPQTLVNRVSAYRCLIRGLPFLPLAVGELVAFWIYPITFQRHHDTRAQCLFGQRQIRGQALELPGLPALMTLQGPDVVQTVGRRARQIVHNQST